MRTMCAAAGIDPHLFAGSGESLPLARLEAIRRTRRPTTCCSSCWASISTTRSIRRAPPARRPTPSLARASSPRPGSAANVSFDDPGGDCSSTLCVRWAGWLTGGGGRITCAAHGLGSATLRYTGADSGGRFTCLFRQGRLMHLPTAWALPPAVVVETQCRARGGDACVYKVHWHGRPRWTPAVVALSLFDTPEALAAARRAGADELVGKESFIAGLSEVLERLFPGAS